MSASPLTALRSPLILILVLSLVPWFFVHNQIISFAVAIILCCGFLVRMYRSPHNIQQGAWFRKKTHGWGWIPATWLGWLCTLFYVLFMVEIFIRVDSRSHSGSDTLIGISIPFVILTALMVTLWYAKGEK